MPIESVMPSSHLILCCPLLLLPSIPPSIRVFSNESALHMRWPKLSSNLQKPYSLIQVDWVHHEALRKWEGRTNEEFPLPHAEAVPQHVLQGLLAKRRHMSSTCLRKPPFNHSLSTKEPVFQCRRHRDMG